MLDYLTSRKFEDPERQAGTRTGADRRQLLTRWRKSNWLIPPAALA